MASRIGQKLWPVLAGLLLAACGGNRPPPGIKLGGGGHAAANGGGVATGGGAANGPGTGTENTPPTFQVSFPTRAIGDNLDLLFVIDDSSQMASMQQKLATQIPALVQVLAGFPTGLPDIHIAVVSSDMGASGDATASLGCTATGDGGQFQSQPRGPCTSTTLDRGATFLTEAGGLRNFTDPSFESVLQCILPLGNGGCQFQQPLAAIARALGADGAPPPASNAGFLRPNALLGIVILSNQDDCSAPDDTTIFSLNGGQQSITNPDGPLTGYRCNGGPRGGHLCTDLVTGQTLVPPLDLPWDAGGNPPYVTLASCRDNDTGSSALTPVQTFVQQIKALKPDPDHQIAISAITGPATPYDVQWVQPYSTTPDGPGQLWPQVMHACGVSSDGSFGDPAVRTRQFVNAFANGELASICDTSYRQVLTNVLTLTTQLPPPSCVALPANIPQDGQGSPACTVVQELTDDAGKQTTVLTPNCNENGGAAPCWTLTSDLSCPSGDLTFNLNADQAAVDATSLTITMNCALCQPTGGSPMPGC